MGELFQSIRPNASRPWLMIKDLNSEIFFLAVTFKDKGTQVQLGTMTTSRYAQDMSKPSINREVGLITSPMPRFCILVPP
jgi:hypothetical protein